MWRTEQLHIKHSRHTMLHVFNRNPKLSARYFLLSHIPGSPHFHQIRSRLPESKSLKIKTNWTVPLVEDHPLEIKLPFELGRPQTFGQTCLYLQTKEEMLSHQRADLQRHHDTKNDGILLWRPSTLLVDEEDVLVCSIALPGLLEVTDAGAAHTWKKKHVFLKCFHQNSTDERTKKKKGCWFSRSEAVQRFKL